MEPAFFFFSFITFVLAVAPCAGENEEVDALMAFKMNLNDPLGAFNGWDATTSSAPCDWRGVFCTNGRVTELRLPRLQLGGQLSDRIGNLRMLRTLSLRSNALNGTIPPSLSHCTRLRAVYLQENSLTGKFPLEIGNLTDLQVINLAGNSLSGEVSGDLPLGLKFIDISSNTFSGQVPSAFGNLTQLQIVNLAFNRFTGEIPANLGKLQSLQYLWLDNNLLQGTLPSALANCSSLVHLSAEGNALGGVIPSAIGALPYLQFISLSRNKLTGTVPVSLFCNTSSHPPSLRTVQLGLNAFTEVAMHESGVCFSVLQVLDLGSNGFNGGFPLWLTSVNTLVDLDVSGNFFTGSVIPEIGNLTKLEKLKMANNSFSGVVPLEIKKCSLLNLLDLEGNKLSGDLPTFLGDMRELRVLSLGGNKFSGPVPATFPNLVNLEILNLRHNSLTGRFPEDIMALTNLTELNLSGNEFSGEVPSSIGNLSRIAVLNLSENSLSGKIPSSLGNLFKLTALDFSMQNFSGELPLELFGLPNLQVIAFQENSLSGDVPEGFSSLMSLRYLNLSSNSFSGQIPQTFEFLGSLAVLSLSDNHISGFIPPEIANCSNLETLELRSNYITGHIPADLSRLSRLNVLDLGGNNLTDEIPLEIHQCSSMNVLLLNNNHLTGNIPNLLSKLSNLTILDLSYNNLTGDIPANLTLTANLVYFNVSNNDLKGEIPTSLAYRFKIQSAFANNKDLCGNPLDIKCKDKSGKNTKKRLILFVVVAAIGGFLLSLFCCCYLVALLRWRKRLKEKSNGEKKHSPARASSRTSRVRSSSSTENGEPKLVMFNNKITLAETIEATRQFDEENVLSRNTRYGLLFKASYNDGMVLSIRRLPNASFDESMFRREAEFLGKVKHRNLTVLRGYYAGPPDRLLVFDYMPNGNLATLLQEASHQDGHVLNWPMRHLIALGVARGLAFLHMSNMVHGDIKPQNVLFDADFEAHLSDFGLDRLMIAAPAESTPSTSASVGTLGYVSPEATLTGEVTKESDAYSFGIVLLELLTGKRPVMFTQDEDIVKWVKKQLQIGQVTELLEPGLLELDPESSEWEEFLLGIKVGLLCTARDPLDRPTMSDIVFMLEGCRVGPDIPSTADPSSQPSPTE